MASKTALRDARERAGLSARELARRAGIAESTVSIMQRGYWGTADDRAKVLGVLGGDPSDLFPMVPAAELKRGLQLTSGVAASGGAGGPSHA